MGALGVASGGEAVNAENLAEVVEATREGGYNAEADFSKQIINALPVCPTCHGSECAPQTDQPGACVVRRCPDCIDGRMDVFRALAIARAVMEARIGLLEELASHARHDEGCNGPYGYHCKCGYLVAWHSVHDGADNWRVKP